MKHPIPSCIALSSLVCGVVLAQTTPSPGLPWAPNLPMQAAVDQFAPHVPPAVSLTFDNARGEIVHYETIQLQPILVTADGNFVLVANDADNRVVVLDAALGGIVAEIPTGQGICAMAERLVPNPADPGGAPISTNEVWVTLRHQMAVVVIDTTDWTVDWVLRPPIDPTLVGARYASSPGGIVFDAQGSKAYVAQSDTDSVGVYDATTVPPSHLVDVPVKIGVSMNEPLAMARLGDRVYVASYRSGNDTLVERFQPPSPNTAPIPGIPLPDTYVIDLATSPFANGRWLPDFDIAAIDTNTDTIVATEFAQGVGTLLNGIGVLPTSQRLVVSNLESRNAEFLGEASFPNGQVVLNRLTYVDVPPGAPPVVSPPVVTENLTQRSPWVNVVLPSAIAVDPSERVFVTGYGSSNVGVFDAGGAYLGIIPLAGGVGPNGVFHDPVQDRLYVYSRADDVVFSFDVSGGAIPTSPLAFFSLPDPTYDTVREGRTLFLDPSHSAAGVETTSCASCHNHLRNDGQTWDLSKYLDPPGPYTLANPPLNWLDRKGPMQTQDLRSLREVPPYHWRGEQNDLEAFNAAFANLLRGTEMSAQDFVLLKEFMLSAVYPANPFQMMNRSLSDVAGTDDATAGADLFFNVSTDPRGACVACHEDPSYTDAGATDSHLGIVPANDAGRSMKTTQLRGMWTKTSDFWDVNLVGLSQRHTWTAMTGTGFFHSGVFHSAEAFVNNVFGGLNDPDEDNLVRFLHEIDSGIAPAANYMEMLDVSDPTAGQFLTAQAELRHCDLVGRGWYLDPVAGWAYLGMLYEPVNQVFITSYSALPPFTLAELQGFAAAGLVKIQLIGVPLDSGVRMGVDRDRDGLRDLDETFLYLTDPIQPDTDGDGFWDGYDTAPTVPATVNQTTPAPSVIVGPTVEWATTNSIKISYVTDRLSATRIEWGPSGGALTNAAGDPLFPLPSGVNPTSPSNRWRYFHTAVIRLTEEGTAYDWRVVTQGQNGQQGTSAVVTTSTLADELTPELVVTNVGFTSTTQGATTTYSATVTVEDNHGSPVSAATVRGSFVQMTAGTPSPTETNVVGSTNASGQVTLSLPVTGQATGDGMAFTIRMRVVDPADPALRIPSVSKGGHTFKWSESPMTTPPNSPIVL